MKKIDEKIIDASGRTLGRVASEVAVSLWVKRMLLLKDIFIQDFQSKGDKCFKNSNYRQKIGGNLPHQIFRTQGRASCFERHGNSREKRD